MNIHERLLNWSYYVTLWLEDPSPKQPSTCRSFEKNYIPELGNLYADVEPHYEPDQIDGEEIEQAIKGNTGMFIAYTGYAFSNIGLS
mgnify:CR=1 FL=1